MVRLTYRGDAPAVAQKTLLPVPPAGFSGSITITVSNKSITLDAWNPAKVAAAWNGATANEFDAATASVVEGGVLLTARTAGVPFIVSISYGGSSTFDEVVLITKSNFDGSTTGTVDVTFEGETFTIANGFDAAELLAELEALDAVDPGDIVAEDVSDDQIRLTFAGQYAGVNAPELTIDDGDLRGGTADVSIESLRSYSAGQNEVQRIVIGGAPESGSITYDLDGTAIGPIAYNADQAAYQSAFDTALGVDNSDVTFVDDSGETGPLQKLYGTTTQDSDDGYAGQDSSVFDNTGQMVLGFFDDDYLSAFALISFPTAIPGNVEIDLGRATLKRAASSTNAALTVSIKAVDVADPTTITDAADLAGRSLTTASVSTTLYGSTTGTVVLPNLKTIIQELIDTHGEIDSVLLVIETVGGSSFGWIAYEDHSIGYVASNGPELEIHYRDGAGGPTVIDVEFIGDNAETDLPLMTADVSALQPKRRNTIWRIEIVRDTGAPVGTPGSLQLFEGATLKHFAGTNEAPVAFDQAATSVFNAYFGAGNWKLTNDPAIAGRVDIELIGDRGGATNLPADLVLYWFAYTTGEAEGNPVARIELINEGADGLGEQQRLTISGDVYGGAMAIKIGSQTTAQLNHDFDADDLETAVSGLAAIGAGKVEVTGNQASGFLFSFDASLGNVGTMQVIGNLKAVGVRIADQGYQQITNTDYRYTTQYRLVLTTNAGAVTLTGGGNVANGTFYADAATVQGWFRTLFGSKVLSVSANGGEIQAASGGGFTRTWGIILETIGQAGQISLNFPNEAQFISEFQGNLTNQTSYVTSIAIVVDGTPTSGSYRLDLNGLNGGGTFTTRNVQWNNTPAEVAAAFNLTGGLEVTATGSANAFTLSIVSQSAFQGFANLNTLAGTAPTLNVETVREYEAVANERQLLTIDDYEFAGGGYVELTHSGETTAVYYPFDQNDIENAMNSIGDLNGNVSVVSAAYNAWRIEFDGDLAGDDVALIAVNSQLEPIDPSGEFSTATWFRIQNGTNGASVMITERVKGSPALGAQYRLTVLGDPHFGTYTTTINGDTSAALEFDSTASENKSAAEALDAIDVGEVLVVGDLAGGMLFAFDPSVGAVTMTAANVDLTNSRVAVLEYIRGGKLQVSELVRSAGPEHFDDPLNWKVIETGASRIPSSGDLPIFENGRIACLYGIQQRSTFTVDISTNELILDQLAGFRVGQGLMVKTSDTLPGGLDISEVYTVAEYDRDSRRLKLELDGEAVTINNAGGGTHEIRLAVGSLVHRSRFTAAIGLPRTSAGGYREYLPTSLAIGFDPGGEKLLKIGEGNGSSSGRIRIDAGGDQLIAEIHQTGGATELGVPAVVINGTNWSNEFEQFDGDVGLGFFEGDAFHFTKLRIHSGSLFYGFIQSAASCDFRNLGGSVDGREGIISGKISSKP